MAVTGKMYREAVYVEMAKREIEVLEKMVAENK